MFRISPASIFEILQRDFDGELYYNDSTAHAAMRVLYATDASVYQEKPLAVALPKTVEDLKKLVLFTTQNKLSLIPRAAGTSLAGQVVGTGVVVDISKHFGKVLEINALEKWVRVQPGVVRDDLNKALQPFGLMFGPETSTANRAMVGGMIGNNSCGLHSIVWGSTRDHLLEVKVILADGNEAHFKPMASYEAGAAQAKSSLERQIYQVTGAVIEDAQNQELIRARFPKPTVTRRNTGYALDTLVNQCVGNEGINLSKLIAGSEGTLCFVTEAKLQLLPLPPAAVGLVCAHFGSIDDALQANLIALDHGCAASELMDDYIIELAQANAEQAQNAAFVQGKPKAILMVEFFEDTDQALNQRTEAFIAALTAHDLGYAYPVLVGEDSKKAWTLRKAGLSLMYNIEGNEQPANVIEDCAVDVRDLPDYIKKLEKIAAKHNLRLEHSAHAAAGEIHSLPLINLKSSAGRQTFRDLLADTAALVKSFGGSLSGEHGDGRLRGEFIEFMVGDEVYGLFEKVKNTWDANGIFNPGKIVNAPPMNEFLRYEADVKTPQIETIFEFKNQDGILGLAEKCSGSGDCRKTHLTGGTMCPSFMATRSEHDTTRARANILRNFLTNSNQKNRFDHDEIKDVMDLCLSCKGCKSECPSNVDVGKMKAEFLQHYYDANGVPLRARLVGNFTKQMRLAALVPWAYNLIFGTPAIRRLVSRLVGFHPDRTMPLLAKQTLKSWVKNRKPPVPKPNSKRVYLFCDEFSNYNDVAVGQKMILLLEKLGYEVLVPKHIESARTYLSKGLLRDAKRIVIENVNLLKDVITNDSPLIGIEPSAILSFRDEYLDLVPPELKTAAAALAKNTLLFEEFIARESDAGRISPKAFSRDKKTIKVHGHCHQKALSSMVAVKKTLSLPVNYSVQLIPSGCCGMAGSFGYEQEHYDVSMQIGELVLFPTIRQQPAEVIIAAAGTSCRHQIHDGTQRTAQHPAEILWDALR